MLAVACGSVVTLWDPSTNSLVATLCHPTGSEHVLKVAFVEGNETPCLVAVTSGRCYVWNLLTGSVWWSVDLGGQALALVVDADTARFSVSVGVRKSTGKADAAGSDSAVEVDAEVKKVGKIIESRVLEFEAASPVPKMVFAGEGHIQGLQYLNKAQIPVGKGDVARLVILSSKYELLAVGPKAQAAALSSAESSEAVSVSNDDAAGLFSGIYGSTAFQQTPTSLHLEANAQKPETMQTVKELASVEASKLAFMGAASHLLPPPMKLAGAYFDAILKKRDMEEERVERAMYGMTGAVQDEDDNDEEMEETTEVAPVKSKELTAQDLLGFEFLGGVFKKLAIKNEKEAIAAAVPAVTVKDAKVITVTSKSSSPAGKGSVRNLCFGWKRDIRQSIVIDDDVPVTASKKGKKKKTI
ncbi:hypothetical protein BCR33DRAFT_337059 [Rhizoclosmatium globosum]|uniref:WD repeat-containing protein 75 second beta-propeller domain-containing protein n=1 Tax=Rhizoclosmatium globosum TaxID=329046 RepID=A0A1Y2C3P1_9FUNG|nr:hypothetical protein BCR33DRAFT_337059 [Rhizoclosmatium globosum]|eukprot:ORY41638.1 hypothetical protein BCR33DRAFT_337059 [Rhizoclosmatium globosum]